tara:strand:- start:487 stop:798 length:312 start_codon:yes stop_codon:yes gene_type:complete
MAGNDQNENGGWTADESLEKLVSLLGEKNLSVDQLFAQIDADGDGKINGPELHKGLKSILGDMLSPGQIFAIIQKLDTNNDNRVDIKEFKKAVSESSDRLGGL